MKKKLLSLFLALSMLLTSVLCLLPVAAEGDTEDPTDAAQRAAGKVCRVGTVEEASASDYAGYYDNVNTAVSVALGNGKTVTLIADTNLTSKIEVSNGKTFVFEGNNKTLTVSAAFQINDSYLTVKNTNIKADNISNELGIVKGGVMTFEKCSFTTTSAYNRAGGLFSFNSSSKVLELSLKDCVFSIDNNSSFAKQTDMALFMEYNNSQPLVTLDHTTIDISGNSLGLCGSSRFTLAINGNSDIKTTQKIKPGTVTIVDSKVENTSESINLFDYNYGTAMNISATNATLKAKMNVFNFSGCNGAVNVVLNGSTTIEAGQFAFYMSKNNGAFDIQILGTSKVSSTGSYTIRAEDNNNSTIKMTIGDAARLSSPKRIMCFLRNSAPVNVTVCGSAKLLWGASESGIYANGPKCDMTLSILDSVSFEAENKTSTQDVISVEGSADLILKSFTLNLLGSISVSAPKSIFFKQGDTKSVINQSASVKLDCETMYKGKDGTRTVNIIADTTPTMIPGASVRLVEGSSGLRFSSTLANLAEGATVKLVRYGTLIAIHSELGTNDFTIAALEAAGIEFANIVATEEGTVAGDGFDTYNAALTNIPDDYCSVDFAARAYAVYEIDGVEYYVYTDYNEDNNVRNFYEICESALADTLSSSDPNYTKAGYPYQIAGGGKTSGAPILLRSVNCSEHFWQKKTDDRNYKTLATI